MFRLAFIIPLISLSASAVPCMWTIQNREKFFTKDPIYQEEPKIERTACKPGQPPICTGYIYCKVPGVMRSASGVACKSIKVDGKWRCPDAQTCVDDEEIAISPTKIPGGAKPAGQNPPPATATQ